MIRWSMLLMLSVATVCFVATTSAEEKAATKKEKAESTTEGGKKKDGEKKFTAKCPVSGADASEEQFASYKDKQVYFCCEKCKAAFEAEPAKYEVKANHQLVQTKQFKQKKCPISGGDFVKEQSARVSNVNVRFCCEKCKGAVQDAEADAKMEMIFSAKAFKKAFVAVKDKSEGDKAKTDEPKEKAEK